MQSTIVVIAICVVVANAQLFDLNEERFNAADEERVVSLTLDCVCSPTSREPAAGAKNAISAAIAVEGTQRLDAFNKCAKDYSYEDCINADAALRAPNDQPIADTLCSYVKPSGRNVVDAGNNYVKTVAACDMDEKTESKSTDDAPEGNGEVAAEGQVVKESDKSSKKGVDPKAVNPNFEGCVAVEHLRGYVLQHSRNLRRHVLCAREFCATPNHALIVDGRWTSMKRLCRVEWRCVGSVKYVNNLDVFANRRVRYNQHIIITPYDLRFPRWGVWLVQAIGYLLNVRALATCVAAGAVALVAYTTSRYGDMALSPLRVLTRPVN